MPTVANLPNIDAKAAVQNPKFIIRTPPRITFAEHRFCRDRNGLFLRDSAALPLNARTVISKADTHNDNGNDIILQYRTIFIDSSTNRDKADPTGKSGVFTIWIAPTYSRWSVRLINKNIVKRYDSG